MKLTGKCKEEFREFYNNRPIGEIYHTSYSVFMAKTISEQIGVLIDYFDTVGVDIEICKYQIVQEYFYIINDGDEENSFESRPEARTAAIEKANELRNEY
tara:strand:- start:415 stop:714 length:300 start_codon:yes stop_codon:yes gene_type:complete